MLSRNVRICSGILLLVSAGVQASGSPEVIYPECVDESNRFEMRALSNECDNEATAEAKYHVGIFRPANPNDDLSALDVPDCENGSFNFGYGRGYGDGYGYGNPYGDYYGYGPYGWGDGWEAGSTLYLCLGAPGTK